LLSGTGIEFAFGMSNYLKPATNFRYIGNFILCAIFLTGTILHGSFIWRRLKELEP
jgi:hypothetical protein